MNKHHLRKRWLTCLTLIYAIWWGGLVFYAGFVVPIATHQIGSTGQGFISQQVTDIHNALLTVVIFCLFIESWWQQRRRLWVIGLGLAVVDAGLYVQHSRLTEIMNFQDQSVSADFYTQHAIYLWLTTAELLLGLALPFTMVLCTCNANLTMSPDVPR